jgi:hypothetical protein
MNPEKGLWITVPTLVFVFGFSYIFWSTLIFHSLKFIGLCNPFGSSV